MAPCVLGLVCCFVSVVGGWARGNFAVALHFPQTIDGSLHTPWRLASSAEWEDSGRVLSVCFLVLAVLVVHKTMG